MKTTLLLLVLVIFHLKVISQPYTFSLKKEADTDTSNTRFMIPVFSTGGNESEADLDEQDVSSLLHASKDLFTQFAGFQFGSARFRMRGYSTENQQVMINGIPLNHPETGISSWSSWAGLNDVTRFTETRFGNVANRYGFSGVGGYTNIDSKASSFKKGTRISYASANRIFRNRIMLTHATGLMKNGWALTVSASSRWGNEVYVPGTWFDAKAFYGSLDKQLNKKHLFSLTAFTAPVERGLAGTATREVFDITHNNYYNSNWGLQNGKLRNASVSKTNHPTCLFTHIYSPHQNKRFTSSLYATAGKSSLSGLNFHNAPNPRPDYYNYLPSFYYSTGDLVSGNALKTLWEQDVNTRQINWDKLIAMNQANLYSPDAANTHVNTTDTRARYILENRVESKSLLGFNILYNERKENLFLSAGANGFIYRSNKYKEIADLLGATFWIDVDQFAQNLGVDPMLQQNDISRPDRKVYSGDRFGYDYTIHIQRIEAWGMAEYSYKKTEVYVAANLSNTNLWRHGNIANGKFPYSSKGKSSVPDFLNYGFKAGGTYKLNGRNFITVNSAILTRAPKAANVFVSPRVRNDVVDAVPSEEVLSGDIGYSARFPQCKIRFTLYSTQINNQTWLRTYYDDSYNTLVNMIMTGANQQHRGFELGIEKIILSSHSFLLVSGFAQSYYTNQPKLQAWQDNTNTSLYFNRRVYLKNYRLGNSPQFVSSVAYRYTGKKKWTVGFSCNYIDHIYIAVNPDRRTQETAGKFQNNEKHLADEILAQERLPAYFIVNANFFKSFIIQRKNTMSCNLSINNLLNTTRAINGGYEQLRWNIQQTEQFANKYSYMHGISYMLGINFNF